MSDSMSDSGSEDIAWPQSNSELAKFSGRVENPPSPPGEEIFDPENYAFRDFNHVEPMPENATPAESLLWAAQSGDLALAEQLLLTDAELVRTQDCDGYSPLHRACYSDTVDMVDLLLSRGAPVDMRTEEGWTPLHSACKWGNHRCVLKLLMHGAPINAASNSGQTALHIAASCRSDKKCLKLLLSWPGLDPDCKNVEGETAYEKALINTKKHFLFDAAKKCTLEIE